MSMRNNANRDDCQLVSPLALIAGRVRHVEELCRRFAHEAESPEAIMGLSDRAWLSRTVLDILAGNRDQQICQEILQRRQPLSERISRSHLRPLP